MSQTLSVVVLRRLFFSSVAADPEMAAAYWEIADLLQNRLFQRALTLTKTLIQSKTLTPSPSQLYQSLADTYPDLSYGISSLLVSSYSQLNLPDSALDILTHISTNRHPSPSRPSLNLLLESLVSSRRYLDSLKLFRQMESFGIPPDTFAYNKAVQSAFSSGQLEMGMGLVGEMRRRELVDTFTYNVIISRMWKEGRAGDAVKLFDEMPERRVLPNQVTYNAMIDGYCKSGNLDAAFGVKTRMVEAGVKPNVITYNCLVGGLCRAKRMDESRRILKEMEANRLVPNGFTYGLIFDGYAKNGESDAAVALYEEELVGKGFRIDGYTCGILLNGLCKEEKVAKAEELLETSGLVPTRIMYNTIVDGYCKIGDMDGAFSAKRRMSAIGLSPGVITYNSLINGLCKLERMKEAEELVVEMEKSGVAPGLETLNTLIDGYGRTNRFEKCFEILEEMQTKFGFAPNIVTYASLMNGLCKKGKLLEAEAIFQDMLAREIRPNAQSYNIFVDAYCTSGDLSRARELIDDMRRRGVRPSIVTFNSLIKGLCGKGSLSEAEELLNQLREKDPSPDAVTYNILISAHGSSDNVHRGLELYNEMKQLGIKASKGTLSLLSTLNIEGQTEEVDNSGEQMFQENLVDNDAGTEVG